MTFRKGRLLRGYVDNDRASCCRRKRRGLHPLRVIYFAPTTRRNQNCANYPAENRNSEKAGSLESGSRSEPARLRRPRLASGTATRPSRKTAQYGKNGRAGERGGTPPPARLLRASTAALPGSPCSSFVPSGEPAPSPLYPQLLETKDLSRKTGTPALAQRVLVLRKKTLNCQQGPNGAWVGHLPSGTSVREDARYPLPP